jgi:cytochrome c553
MISAFSQRAMLVVNLLAPAGVLLASANASHAGDIKAGAPDSPNIAGQVEPYLVAQLQAFKTGARKSDAMSAVTPSLSDTDIEDLAAYFSAIEISIGKLPER